MNKKIIFTWLVVVMIITMSGCGGKAPTEPPASQPAPSEEPTTPPATEAPATEAPTATEAPATATPPVLTEIPDDKIIQQLIAYTLPANTKDWTIPMKAGALIDLAKQPFGPPDSFGGQTPVGVVEIGPGSALQQPGIYLVTIELGNTGDNIPGRMYPFTDPGNPGIGTIQEVSFQGVAQELNPARNDSPYEEFQVLNTNKNPPPAVSTAIGADSVCFVVRMEDETYIRYCSESGSPLSVSKNFPSQFGELQASINGAVDSLGQKYLNPDAKVLTDQIISEKEDTNSIGTCKAKILNVDLPPTETPLTQTPVTKSSSPIQYPTPALPLLPPNAKPNLAYSKSVTSAEQLPDTFEQVCSSDIAVAPLEDPVPATELTAQSQLFPAGGQFMLTASLEWAFRQAVPSPQTVAVVQILNPIDADTANVHPDNSDIIQPGNYRLDYWYHPDPQDNTKQVFYAATISGETSTGVQVLNQPVPAVPATFVNQNDNDPPPPGAQISVCRIFGVCTFFQKSCS